MTTARSELLVENIDPFWLCVGLLAEGTTTIGRVAWGAGKAFVAIAPSIAEEADIPTRIWYWGDGDPEGVRMPAAAAPIVAAAGLPPLEPAVRLWRAYARVEVRGQGNYQLADRPIRLAWFRRLGRLGRRPQALRARPAGVHRSLRARSHLRRVRVRRTRQED